MKNKPFRQRQVEPQDNLAFTETFPAFCAEFPGEFPWTVPDSLETEFGSYFDEPNEID